MGRGAVTSLPWVLGAGVSWGVRELLATGKLHFTPDSPCSPLGKQEAVRAGWGSPRAAAGLPFLPQLTRLPEDVGSGTYKALCGLVLGSVFETLPPSRRNLDFTHPILW